MSRFLSEGYNCYCLDFNLETMSGVQRLGAEITDLKEGTAFDLIVASHVLEHVAQPRRVLQDLVEHLQDGGRIYVEVPMEIKSNFPAMEEPVTHINWFVRGSLVRMFEECKLDVVEAKYCSYMSTSGRRYPGILAVGRKQAGAAPNEPSNGFKEVEAFRSGGILSKLRACWYFRASLWQRIKRRLARR